ncbi:hypothetical protein F5Y12DRAFT_291805 [Xylaria sp. FL1777]|nr:hypothetical protein F5Y12DRAFT_291805 [Xylaria sp. FL1777]
MKGRITKTALRKNHKKASPTEVSFKCFRELPPEIRCRIWELTIPCRLVSIRLRALVNIDNIDSPHMYPPPVAARVCHESRDVVQRVGIIIVNGIPERLLVEPQTPEPQLVWFNKRRDTFRVMSIEGMDCLPCFVENLLVDWAMLLFCYRDTRFFDYGIDFSVLPKLRLFQFSIDWRFIPREICMAWANRMPPLDVLGTILLDIDDDDEVREFSNMLLSHPEWDWLSPLWLKELKYLREEKFSLHATHEKQDWEIARKQLQERWASLNGDARTRIPEFRRVLSLMPFSEVLFKDAIREFKDNRYMLFTTREPKRRVPGDEEDHMVLSW